MIKNTKQSDCQTVDAPTRLAPQPSAARPLHPEDLEIGDDVAVLYESAQYPTFVWCGFDTARMPIEEPIKITYLPCGDHEALKVKDICLPGVIAAQEFDELRNLRPRQFQRSNACLF